MKFCSECGSKVIARSGPNGAPTRFVCTACRASFFQDPRLSAGCIAEWQGRILLCRRAVDPGEGLWELPSGFIADGETVESGALREVLEEAGATVAIRRPYALLHMPRVNQMRVIYLAQLLDDRVEAGIETLEVRLFEEGEVPWNEIAFASTRTALKRYFTERKSGILGFFFAEILPFDERGS
ncbi:MAG TPA: NUDIX hydrolase [Usitatibacter sp.]|nr:NUDIX hydrolase [Usitatibacter sp.]